MAKPGTFQKGFDPRRVAGGRPKALVEVIEAARAHTPDAIARLAYWMHSEHPTASPAAAQALLDRGWGKPVQPQEVTGKDGGPIQTQVVEDGRVPLDAFLAEFGKERDDLPTKH